MFALQEIGKYLGLGTPFGEAKLSSSIGTVSDISVLGVSKLIVSTVHRDADEDESVSVQ